MEAATGDVIVLIDADGSMDPRELYRYVRAARRADLVKGSRFAQSGGSDDISLIRKLGNLSLLALVNVLYGARLTDLCYGFCAVRREALPAMALCSDGFEIETEMTVRALRAGLRVVEVPSFEAPRRYGESHLCARRDGWRVLRTLLRERFRREPSLPVTPAPEPAAMSFTPALSAAAESGGIPGASQTATRALAED
jgi:glycosyltransferase involved in cell wall biosynthesis